MTQLVIPTPIENLPRICLVAPTISLRDAFIRELKDRGELLTSRKPLTDAIPWFANQRIAVIGPVFGLPLMYMAASKLAVSGCSHIFFPTFVGAIRASLPAAKIGDLFLPTEVTHCSRESFRSIEVTNLSQIESSEFAIQRGKVLSIVNPFQETTELIAIYASHSISAVEMELYALVKVAKNHEMGCSIVGIISDTLADARAMGFKEKRFQDAVAFSVKTLTDEAFAALA